MPKLVRYFNLKMKGNSVSAAASAAPPATVPEASERVVAEESCTVSETTELLPVAHKGWIDFPSFICFVFYTLFLSVIVGLF